MSEQMPQAPDARDAAMATTTTEENRQTAAKRQADVETATRLSAADVLKSAGQRRINAIWEMTQATIAAAVVGTVLYVNAAVALSVGMLTEGQSSALMQLNVMGALVIGFYFGRTNHQRVGGVGADQHSTRIVLILPLMLTGYIPILIFGYPLVLPMILQACGLAILLSHIVHMVAEPSIKGDESMTNQRMTSADIQPTAVVVIGGTGDGAPLTTGTTAVTPAHQPNLLVTVISPLMAIAIRFINAYLTMLVALVGAGMTTNVLPASDFGELILACAKLSVAGAGLGALKDAVTIFGKLEGKYPLGTGSV